MKDKTEPATKYFNLIQSLETQKISKILDDIPISNTEQYKTYIKEVSLCYSFSEFGSLSTCHSLHFLCNFFLP